MIKECLVLINNSSMTVVRYDSKEIQFPSIRKKAKTVFVKYENGKYEIVDKPDIIDVPEEKEVICRKPQKKNIVKYEIPEKEIKTNVDEKIDEKVSAEEVIADAE